jgi:hypothetical protein
MLISGAEIKLPNTGVLMSRTGSNLPGLATQRPRPPHLKKWVRSAKLLWFGFVLPKTRLTKSVYNNAIFYNLKLHEAAAN